MKRLLLASALLGLTTSPVTAATITISDVDGFFGTATGGNVTGQANTDTYSWIRWGSSTGSQSGYDFYPTVPPNIVADVPPDSGWFLLGNFWHLNEAITSGTGITSVGFDVGLTMTIDAANLNPLFAYMLTHNETTNTVGLCPAFQQSTTPCDDQVIVSNPSLGVFVIDGVTYTLQLGFSKDGGTTIVNEFITEEGQNNLAGLYARFTSDIEVIPLDPVPEPATLLLLGSGLGAVAARRRLKKRA